MKKSNESSESSVENSKEIPGENHKIILEEVIPKRNPVKVNYAIPKNNTKGILGGFPKVKLKEIPGRISLKIPEVITRENSGRIFQESSGICE